MEVLRKKTLINGPLSMAMLNNQRVTIFRTRPGIKKYQQHGPIKQSWDFRHVVFMVNPQPGSMPWPLRRPNSTNLCSICWGFYKKSIIFEAWHLGLERILQAVLRPLYAPKINMKKKKKKKKKCAKTPKSTLHVIQTCSDMSLPQRMPLTPGMQETIQTIPASKITHPLTPEDR